MDLPTNSSKTRLRIDGVTAGFNDKIIIKDINLELKCGKTLCLLGKSGIGKSTLLNVVAGLLQPFVGRVFLNEEDITGETGHISYMLQKDMLLPFKTVEENIALPLIIKGEKKSQAIKKVRSYLEDFGIDGYGSKYPSSLSGGMRQRAALLRCYLFSTQVVLLDEPFSALDYITKYKMHKWYEKMSEELGLSTIFITHDIDEALKLADIIYIMKGSPATIEDYLINDKKNDNLSEDFLKKKRKILGLLDMEKI